jgi:c-di-GMP-binding flagellar brake protein YcgR
VYKNQERRKYKRIEKPYMVRFQVKQYKGLEISYAEWDMVALKDLCAGGVFFNSSKNLGINSLLDLKIDVSTDSSPIECVGTVLRVKKQQYTSIFGIAAAFMEIGAQDKEMINKTAAEISRQERQTPITPFLPS